MQYGTWTCWRYKKSYRCSDNTFSDVYTTKSSKHRTFSQCWYTVGLSSTTLGQHYTNIGWTSRVCWEGQGLNVVAAFIQCLCLGTKQYMLYHYHDQIHYINALSPFFFTVHNYVPNSGRDQRSHTLLQPTWKSIQLQSVLISSQYTTWGPVFSYKLRYIVGFWLVETAVSTNQKPTMYTQLVFTNYTILCKLISSNRKASSTQK